MTYSWQHQDENGHWKTPITATVHSTDNVDPLMAQFAHFVDVTRGKVAALVTGDEGIKSLKVIEVMCESAQNDRPVQLS